MTDLVYKIATATEWQRAKETGFYEGSPDDARDGFIHLSSRHQLQKTLEKHFNGKRDLVLIAFEADALAPTIKWEPSRNDELFPHVYGIIPVVKAMWERPLVDEENGIARIDEKWFAC
jgi:uncharacterized protein (DUF952 family)